MIASLRRKLSALVFPGARGCVRFVHQLSVTLAGTTRLLRTGVSLSQLGVFYRDLRKPFVDNVRRQNGVGQTRLGPPEPESVVL